MDINKEIIEKLSKISKLDILEETADNASIIRDLQNISKWIKEINKIDTSEVEPLLTMSKEVNILRSDDQIFDPLKIDEVLKNAPEKDSSYIKVPSFVEK